MNLTGKVVVVFGATSGIGLACANSLAVHGATTVLTGRRHDLGIDAARRIVALGGVAEFLDVDVTDETAVARVIEAVVERHGKLDCAVNNAGVEDRELKALFNRTAREFDEIFNTNVRGLFFCMKYEIAAMATQRSGSIINISSTAGSCGVAGFGLYSASKHAVEGLTRSAALELAPIGIRVNSVAPYATESELLDRAVGIGDSAGRTAYKATVPMRRFASASEPAELVSFLCTDQSDFVTGSSIPVDGGMLAGLPVWVDLV